MDLKNPKTFAEVDEALYRHERPYYAYCASGAGGTEHTTQDPRWVARRAELTALWYKLCLCKVLEKSLVPNPAPVPASRVKSFLTWLKHLW